MARQPRGEHVDKYAGMRASTASLQPLFQSAEDVIVEQAKTAAQQPTPSFPSKCKNPWALTRPLLLEPSALEALGDAKQRISHTAPHLQRKNTPLTSLRLELISKEQALDARGAEGALEQLHRAAEARFAKTYSQHHVIENAPILVNRQYVGDRLVTDFSVGVCGVLDGEIAAAQEVLEAVVPVPYDVPPPGPPGIRFLRIHETPGGCPINTYREALAPGDIGTIALGPMRVPQGYPPFGEG